MSRSFDHLDHQLPDLTSDTDPLVAIPIFLRVGTIYATIAPGYQGSRYIKGEGVQDIRRDMSADVARIDRYGIKRLVTTTSAVDILENGMGGLLTDLEGFGIKWSHLPFPISRKQEPDFAGYLNVEMQVIRKDVLDGQKVAVHAIGWGKFLEHRIAVMATMIDPDLSMEEARSMTTAAVRTGHSILRF